MADTFHGPSDAANGAPVQSTFRPASISSSLSERSSRPRPPNFSSCGLPETATRCLTSAVMLRIRTVGFRSAALPGPMINEKSFAGPCQRPSFFPPQCSPPTTPRTGISTSCQALSGFSLKPCAWWHCPDAST